MSVDGGQRMFGSEITRRQWPAAMGVVAGGRAPGADEAVAAPGARLLVGRWIAGITGPAPSSSPTVSGGTYRIRHLAA